MSGIHIADIAASIAALGITGLKIKDLDEIKENMVIGDWPSLVPHPVNFVSNLRAQHDSFGRGQDTVLYTLNYRLYFRPVTGSLKFFGPYDEMIDMIVLVLNKIIGSAPPAHAVDIMPRIVVVGGVEDHAGNVYHGCDFAFDVTEYYEAV